MKKILIITNASTSRSQSQTLRSFVDMLNESEQARFEFCMVQDLVFEMQQGKISVSHNGKELSDEYSLLHIRWQSNYPDYATALRVYCDHTGLGLLNRDDIATQPYGKVSQGFLFGMNGIPTPDFVSSLGNQTLVGYLQKKATYPMILKHNDGVMGLNNHVAKDEAGMKKILAQPIHGFVAQPFIKNSGELRVLTFGLDRSPLIFRKFAPADSHLNNTSRGGGSEKVEVASIDPVIMQDAMAAADVTKREVGGVDVLLAENGQHYILEVNSTPALASGVLRDEKVAAYRAHTIDMAAAADKKRGRQ